MDINLAVSHHNNQWCKNQGGWGASAPLIKNIGGLIPLHSEIPLPSNYVHLP